MFRFTRKPSSGRYSQYLTKNYTWLKVDTQRLYKTLSVLWLHIVTCEACVLCTVCGYTVYSVYRALCEGILYTVCAVHCVRVYCVKRSVLGHVIQYNSLNTVYPHTLHGKHASSQVTICSHNTDNVLYSHYVSTFNQACNFQLSTDCTSLMMVSL